MYMTFSKTSMHKTGSHTSITLSVTITVPPLKSSYLLSFNLYWLTL